MSYELYRDTGLSFLSAFSLIVTVTPDSLTYSASSTSGSYQVRLTYRFKFIATNVVGDSQSSDEAYISFGDVPPQPAAIVSTISVTTRTTIYVKWAQVTSLLPVTGWILNMDDGKLGTMTPIYVGTNRPDLTSYKVGGLTTRLPYRFSVQAIDSNGISIASNTTTIYAWDLPSGIATPQYASSDRSTKEISISWDAPLDDGGCPILGFEVYVDDAATGIPTTKVTSVTSNDPSVGSATVSFSSGVDGSVYIFVVRAINQAGYVESGSIKIALASLPNQPSSSPTSDSTITNTNTLKVNIGIFDDTLSGGSPIISYEIQIDDGNDGDFRSIYTLSPYLIFLTRITRGAMYRIRYRAQNMNEWGPLSDTALLQAATVPSTPPAPIYYPDSSSSTQIYLGFVPPSDNGWAEISGYLLYIVIDTILSAQTQTLIYNRTNLFWNVDSTTYSLVAGTTYKFTLKAVNKFGSSGKSQYVLAALGTYQNQPNAPTKIESQSTQTSITIQWDESPTVYTTPITGYMIYGDNGTGGKFLLYDGSNQPNVLTHTFGGLVTGLPYQFAVAALNINGESLQSSSSEIYACNVSSNFSAPVKISTSKTSITIGWEAPQNNGWPIQSYSIYRDDGEGGSITIEVDSSTVRNQPSLRQYEITGLTPTGATFRFKITATSAAGSAGSSPVSIVLASVPDTPTTGPTSDTSVTNESKN